MPINSTLCYCFLVDLINIEIFRISFSFFYLFSFILRNRATSVCYQSFGAGTTDRSNDSLRRVIGNRRS